MFKNVRCFLAPLLALWIIPSCSTYAADFNAVGREMSRLLQNGHYARLPFNADLSEKFFDSYLETLDPSKLYFLKGDIDELSEKYRRDLHNLLLNDESVPAATEIFEVFRTRLRERISASKEMLENEKFTFDGDRWIMNDREDADWPADAAAARMESKNRLEESLLSEILRREQIESRAKEQGKESPVKDDPDPRKKIALRYDRVLKFYEDFDTEEIANYFFSSVANSYDPHSDYLSARELDQFRLGVSNELVGIGAVLSSEDDGATKIQGIVNKGPADKQGDLQLGDRVVAVDSLNNGEWIDIMFMPIDKVVEKIRGKVDTSVALKVEPADGAGGETHIIVIEREVVTMKDGLASAEIHHYGKGEDIQKIGFLRIPSFYFDFDDRSKRVSVDVERLLKRLKKEEIDGLAIDLRGNGGGSLEEVRRLTGFFVGRGATVQIKQTNGHIQALDSDHRKPIYDGPMVILTDKGSASASEILAGALQDYNRAVIVGDSSTFGKGTVQQPVDIGKFLPLLADRDRAGYIKLTIQKFYRVSGDSTQKKGVIPDVILPSLRDVQESGEARYDNPLPFDRIRKASNFDSFNRQNLFVPLLQEKSEARRKKDQEFKYLDEDIKRLKQQIEENRSSLDKDIRQDEIAKMNERRKARNAERTERFARIEKRDAENLKIYRLSLDDVRSKDLPLVDRDEDRKRNMRRVKDKIADLNDAPEWPSGINYHTREGLNVLRDLVSSIKAGKIAGVLQKP